MGFTFVVQLVFVFILSVLLLNNYANWRRQHIVVLVSTLLGWYFSFLIVLMLPLDVSNTFYDNCLLEEAKSFSNSSNQILNSSLYSGEAMHVRYERNENTLSKCEEPQGYISNEKMLRFWRIVYWTSQLLTWLILPFMQSYSKAGEFLPSGRIKYALYNNFIYYGIYAGVFVTFMLYALSKGVPMNFDSLKVLVVSASNTWGLFLLTLLLGYGLIEVPRNFWNKGNFDYCIERIYFDIDRIYSDKNEAEENAKELYIETRKVLDTLKSTRGDAREKARMIMSRFSDMHLFSQSDDDLKPRNYSRIEQLDVATFTNEKFLVELHRRVIEAAHNYSKYQAQWNLLLHKAFYLEDIECAKKNGILPDRWTADELRPDRGSDTRRAKFFPSRILYYWHVEILSILFKTLGFFSYGMSFMILWNECFFWVVHPKLSLAAKLVHGAAEGYHYKFIQICSITILTYVGVCAYSTVFRLKVYRYYHLDSNQKTNDNSLVFSAMLLCRLTAPMCLNFLGTIHLDAHITSDFSAETQFTKLMGHLDLIPFIARGVNIYFPILIALLSLGSWFKLGTRLLHSFGIEQFVLNDNITVEFVQNGKSLVVLEKNRLRRLHNRENSNKNWNNLLPSCSSSRHPTMSANQDKKRSYSLLEEARSDNDEDLLIPNEWLHPPSSKNVNENALFDDL